MRSFFLPLLLVGCTPTPFADDFSARFCDEWKACTGQPCEFEDSSGGPCSYDEEAATKCLERDWTCDDAVEGEEELLLPASCFAIYYDC